MKEAKDLQFLHITLFLSQMASPPAKARGVYPLYVFADGRSTDVNYAQEVEERHLRLRRLDRHGRPKKRHPSRESNDDFVML